MVTVSVTDEIAWLTITRPEVLNALDPKSVDQFGAHLRALCERDDVRVVVTRSAPRIFTNERSSGIIRQHYTIETLAKMATDSLRTFENFEDEIGGDAGFVKTGVMILCCEEYAAALQQGVEMRRRLGIKENYAFQGKGQ